MLNNLGILYTRSALERSTASNNTLVIKRRLKELAGMHEDDEFNFPFWQVDLHPERLPGASTGDLAEKVCIRPLALLSL